MQQLRQMAQLQANEVEHKTDQQRALVEDY